MPLDQARQCDRVLLCLWTLSPGPHSIHDDSRQKL
jgi:hypothetical protein